MTLSIIIPYYNTKKYTDELLSVLNAQMSDDIEVILVDDGKESNHTCYISVWSQHHSDVVFCARFLFLFSKTKFSYCNFWLIVLY